MRGYVNISAGLLILLLAGCGKDATVKEIQQIRAAGDLPQAREKTLAALQETPGNMDLWLEFTLTAAAQSREAERVEDPQALDYLIEASLVCGTLNKFKNQKLSRDWRNACRLCAAEASKQANQIQTTLGGQAESADYLKQVVQSEGDDLQRSGARMSAERLVDSYRTDARTLLFQSVLLQRLLEALPELTPGSSTTILTQLQTARDAWKKSLELAPDFTSSIQDRANRAVDVAFGQAMGDVQSLGYFIPTTIIENGIRE